MTCWVCMIGAGVVGTFTALMFYGLYLQALADAVYWPVVALAVVAASFFVWLMLPVRTPK